MEPYTAEGMARLEMEAGMQEAAGDVGSGAGDGNIISLNNGEVSDSSSSSSGISGSSGMSAGSEMGSGDMVSEPAVLEQQPKCINYELVGIVVHSGQANAGHYYSFIKDRRLAQTILS